MKGLAVNKSNWIINLKPCSLKFTKMISDKNDKLNVFEMFL